MYIVERETTTIIDEMRDTDDERESEMRDDDEREKNYHWTE